MTIAVDLGRKATKQTNKQNRQNCRPLDVSAHTAAFAHNISYTASYDLQQD